MSDLISLIKDLPKADLNVRIEGTLAPDLRARLAEKYGIQISGSDVDEESATYKINNRQDFINLFEAGVDLLRDADDFYELMKAYLNRCCDENVVHTEVMFHLQAYKKRGIDLSVIMDGFSRAMSEAQKQWECSCTLTMCFEKNVDEESAMLLLEDAAPYKNLIQAVGIESDWDEHFEANFRRFLQMTGDAGYQLVTYAGPDTASANPSRNIGSLKVSRIEFAQHEGTLAPYMPGHGGTIPVITSPLSGVLHGDEVIENAKELLDSGLMVSVSSGYPSYFGGYFMDSLSSIFPRGWLQLGQAIRLIRNSFEACLLPYDTKASYLNRLDEQIQAVCRQHVKIPEDINYEGWPCDGDLLGRFSEVEKLTSILLNTKGPLVLGLNSSWGGGKTVFTKLWIHYLKTEKNVHGVYLNTWENDYFADPLSPLCEEIYKWVLNTERSYMHGNCFENLRFRCWRLKVRFLRFNFDRATANLAKSAFIVDPSVGAAAVAVDHTIKAYRKHQKSIERFRITLEKWISMLPESQRRIIIFVDELDRCRPTYSVMMLERIKHLFRIEGIIFVLAINRDQLCKTFQGVYGSTFDGQGYIRRFIDIDYQLNSPKLMNYIRSQWEHIDVSSLLDLRGQQFDMIHAAMAYLAELFDFQCRDVNQFLERYRLTVFTMPVNYNMYLAAACFIAIRSRKPDLYHKYINAPKTHALNVAMGLINIYDVEDEMARLSKYVGGHLLQIILPREYYCGLKHELNKMLKHNIENMTTASSESLVAYLTEKYNYSNGLTVREIQQVAGHVDFAYRFESI